VAHPERCIGCGECEKACLVRAVTLGKRIFEEKYKFKAQEGFDLSRVRVPQRFYENASGIVTPEIVEEMLRLYRKKRGWN
jgi:ferredoxin